MPRHKSQNNNNNKKSKRVGRDLLRKRKILHVTQGLSWVYGTLFIRSYLTRVVLMRQRHLALPPVKVPLFTTKINHLQP